jgi:hypothetical protein
MVQPNSDERSAGGPAGRFDKLAFIVSESIEARATAPRPVQTDTPWMGSDRECAKWLSERLSACYND